MDNEAFKILERLERDGPINRSGVAQGDSGTGKGILPYALATKLMARDKPRDCGAGDRGLGDHAGRPGSAQSGARRLLTPLLEDFRPFMLRAEWHNSS